MSNTRACPNCGQQTAPQFFRKLGAKELCVLCVQRGQEANKALKEAIEDDKLHGGYGWLWKHIASVVGVVLGYLHLRGILAGFVRSLFGLG